MKTPDSSKTTGNALAQPNMTTPAKPERKKLSATDHIQAVGDSVLRGYIRLQTASRLLHGPDKTALEDVRRKFLGLVSDLTSISTAIEIAAKGEK